MASEPEIDEWVERLSGRKPPLNEDERRALQVLVRQLSASTASPPPDPAALAALLNRMEREGLLEPETASRKLRVQASRIRRPSVYALAATLVVGIALSFSVFEYRQVSNPTSGGQTDIGERGLRGIPGTITLHNSSPEALATQVESELHALGLSPAVKADGATIIVYVQVGADQLAAFQDWGAQHHVAVPAADSYDIRIIQP